MDCVVVKTQMFNMVSPIIHQQLLMGNTLWYPPILERVDVFSNHQGFATLYNVFFAIVFKEFYLTNPGFVSMFCSEGR